MIALTQMENIIPNRRMLSHEPEDKIRNSETVMQFLIGKFDATRREHPFLDNLVVLNGETCLVVSSISDKGVDIYDGISYDKDDLISELKRLKAGVLVFKQSDDGQLKIYLIDNLELLKRHSDYKLFLNWDSVEQIKRLSELGIVLDSKLIGFRVGQANHFNVSRYISVANAKSLFLL